MRLALIAAVGRNRVIGKDNKMPWHLPADLKFFKATTMGKPMIMGRKTWESLGRILPGRRHIVVTRNKEYSAQGIEVAHSIETALGMVSEAREAVVIGGAYLYGETLPLAERLYLTEIDAEFEGDTFFPQWDRKEWEIVSSEFHPADEQNPHACRFVTYNRLS